jgi:predicted  nucleic acid-binding Zn-ribbon protein
MIMITKEQIDLLVKLQEIELESNQLSTQLDELPLKLEKIDGELRMFQETITEEENRLADLKKKYRTHESDAEMNLSRIKKSKDKLGSVKTNKEYQSSLKEIEDLEGINSKIEDDMIECLEAMDGIESIIDAKKSEYSQLSDRVKTEKDLLEQQSHQAKESLARLDADRLGLAEIITPELLKKYNMVKELVGKVAISAVKNAVCQGCNVNIPPQSYNELLRLDTLMFCPHCQRIIYPLAS